MSLRPRGSRVRLYVTDDGAGFDPAPVDGSGLASTRERASSVGNPRISSVSARGTEVEAML